MSNSNSDDTGWHNFNICMHFDQWLLSQGSYITEFTEEEHGETAAAMNWIASVKAMLAAVRSEAEADAERWRYVRKHWTKCRVKYNPDNSLKEMTMTLLTSNESGNAGYAEQHIDEAIRAELAAKP